MTAFLDENGKLVTTSATSPMPVEVVLGRDGGDASAANQVVGNNSLAAIDANTEDLETLLTNINARLDSTLAVNVGLTDAELRASAVPFIASALPLPNGASTETTLAAMSLKLPLVLVDGRLQATSRDYETDVLRGLVASESIITIKGQNSATATVNEPIATLSGTTLNTPSAAVTLTLSSTSAADTLAGTGAQVVEVKYVRFSDLVEVTQNFNMAGQTAVTITADGYAINSVRVIQSGTGLVAAGVIHTGHGAVTAGASANPLATIALGTTDSQTAVYTVPATKVLELHDAFISPSVLSFLTIRNKALKTSLFVSQIQEFSSAFSENVNMTGHVFTAGQQVQFWCRTNAGAGLFGISVKAILRNA